MTFLASRPRALGRFAIAHLAIPLVAGLASAAPPSVAVYPLSQVKPGLAVEARTVFQGAKVESFPLEVLGVVRRGAAAGSLVLARATEPRVEHTGIVAGMSGSPVYAPDGRLVGAIAYAWGFAKDPICGITPIEEMLPVWDLEERSAPGDFDAGGLPAPDVDDSPRTGSSAALPRLRTPLAAAGLAPEVLGLIGPWAADHGFVLTPGGSAPGDAASGGTVDALGPGDALAVDLLRGDASLAAIGTVTAVLGNRLLAFGHPFFLAGPTRLPISHAEITTVIASLENSFKVGTSGTPVGTLTEDRRTAVAGRLGPVPEMLPVDVRVRAPGVPEEVFHYRAVKQRQLAPLLVAAAAVNSALARGAIPSESTWRWKLSAAIRPRAGQPARQLEASDIAPGAGLPVFQALTSLVAGLLDNAWEPVDLDRLDVELDVSPRIEELRVVAARLERPRVRPGETVRVEVDLESHRGPVRTTTLEYRVPEKTAVATLALFVGGGADLARYDAAQAPGRYRSNSVDELLRRLRSYPKSSRLYLAAYAAAPEVSVRGRDYPALPPSAQRVMVGRQSADASTRWGRASLVGDVWRTYDRIVSGGTTLVVEVSPHAPAAGRAARGAGAQVQEEPPEGSEGPED